MRTEFGVVTFTKLTVTSCHNGLFFRFVCLSLADPDVFLLGRRITPFIVNQDEFEV